MLLWYKIYKTEMPRNHQAKGEYKAASSLSSSSKQR